MSRCRSCEAQIDFVKMRSGRWEPVDSFPWIEVDTLADGGKHVNVVLDTGIVATGGLVAAHKVPPPGPLPDGHVLGRTSHFATCNNPARFRR
ncbi:MAG: hypothetical protein KGJ86_06890 [Chloroflexota bacterium]|nr:hypothetical protein [Chloroflexota bacterium]